MKKQKKELLFATVLILTIFVVSIYVFAYLVAHDIITDFQYFDYDSEEQAREDIHHQTELAVEAGDVYLCAELPKSASARNDYGSAWDGDNISSFRPQASCANGYVEQTGDINGCIFLKNIDGYEFESCFQDLAIEQDELKYCEYLDGDKNADCRARVELDTDICLEMQKPSDCIQFVAIKTLDYESCLLIKEVFDKQWVLNRNICLFQTGFDGYRFRAGQDGLEICNLIIEEVGPPLSYSNILDNCKALDE